MKRPAIDPRLGAGYTGSARIHRRLAVPFVVSLAVPFVVSPSASLRTGLSNHGRPFDKLRANG